MDSENSTAEQWLTAHCERVHDEGDVTADVFLRSLSPPLGIRERQEQILKQLEEMQREGHLDTVRVSLWGSGVCLCDVCTGTSAASSMLDTVQEFERWAEEEGDVSLPFEHREVDSAIVDKTSSDLVVPSICVSVTAGTELRGVFPCKIDGEDISVSDYVETLTEKNEEDRHGVSHDQIAQL